MPNGMQSAVDAMFASAASVLGTLAGRTVAAGSAVRTESEASIRIESEVVATVTRIPSADLSFVARYAKRDLARIVELMLGETRSNLAQQIESAVGESDAPAVEVEATTGETQLEVRNLVVGDDPEGVKRTTRERAAELAAECEFDALLFAHGDPVPSGGRDALRTFAEGGQ